MRSRVDIHLAKPSKEALFLFVYCFQFISSYLLVQPSRRTFPVDGSFGGLSPLARTFVSRYLLIQPSRRTFPVDGSFGGLSPLARAFISSYLLVQPSRRTFPVDVGFVGLSPLARTFIVCLVQPSRRTFPVGGGFGGLSPLARTSPRFPGHYFGSLLTLRAKLVCVLHLHCLLLR